MSRDLSRIRNPGVLPQIDFDRIFASMEKYILTVKFERPNLKAVTKATAIHVTKPWETSLEFPKELAKLDKIAQWESSYGPALELQVCGTEQSGIYLPIQFARSVMGSLHGAPASAGGDEAMRNLTESLQNNGWKMGTSTCYRKGAAFVEFYQEGETDLSITVFVPAPSADAVQ
jgi:hypothetical protein